MSRAVLTMLLLVPAFGHAQDRATGAPSASAAPVSTVDAVPPPAARTPAPRVVESAPSTGRTPTASPHTASARRERSLESWIGPLVLAAGGLALVLTAIIGAAQTGCDVATCTEINPLPFTIDLVGGGLLIAVGVVWWLIGGGSLASTAPGGMSGAADVI